MILKSFKDARKAFSSNLTAIMAALNYTPASLSMKLNAEATSNGSVKSIVTATEISEWMTNKKIPSLYAVFKLASFLRVSIDLLMDPELDVMEVAAHSFALQSRTTPKIANSQEARFKPNKPKGIPMTDIVEVLQPISEAEIQLAQNHSNNALGKDVKNTFIDSLTDDDFLNAASATATAIVPKKTGIQAITSQRVVAPVKSTKDLAKISVEKHTTSTKYNVKLAYAILTSKYSVKEVAKACNIGASTLRGYMYYNVPVPKNIAYKILKTIKACNYASLGLKYDEVKLKYTHQTV